MTSKTSEPKPHEADAKPETSIPKKTIPLIQSTEITKNNAPPRTSGRPQTKKNLPSDEHLTHSEQGSFEELSIIENQPSSAFFHNSFYYSFLPCTITISQSNLTNSLILSFSFLFCDVLISLVNSTILFQ
jgi:hypothetical protein